MDANLGNHFLHCHFVLGILLGAGFAGQAVAGKVTDSHGNIGYDTAEECEAAVRVSMKQCDNWFGANFPRPISRGEPLQRPAEPVTHAPAAKK